FFDVTRNTYDLTPDVAYFVRDRWAIGIRVGYSFDQVRFQPFELPVLPFPILFSSLKVRSHLVTVDPIIRYYIPLGDDGKGGLFIQAQLPFRGGKARQVADLADGTTQRLKGPRTFNFTVQLTAAFYYFVTPNIAIEGLWAFAQYRLW
ncbi:hypothetical protein, partial [Xanthovirga aplysinae]|uniref:hypothetical protein n=1 Tax=Xanthovirga aplysinae TaxID=2529853 RepID=UPI001CA41BBE